MRKLVLVLAPVLAVGLIAAGCGSSDDDSGNSQTLDFVSIDNGANINIDNGDPGGSTGDAFTINEDLQQDGSSVGTSLGQCTAIGGKDQQGLSFCQVNLTTDSGTIAAQGSFDFEADKTADFVVIGGTGDYAGASGTATVDISGNGKETPITVDLTTEGGD